MWTSLVYFPLLQVKRLEAQIQMLTENQLKNDERQVRLKEENSFFVERYGLIEWPKLHF